MDYTGGTEQGALQAEAGIRALGRKANIEFDFQVRTHWQPVESQRLLLWAGEQGKQEEFMDEINFRHFQQRQSASDRATLLEAVRTVGLDEKAAAAFLDTDRLTKEVWDSYGKTIREHNIHSIPLFVFHHPDSGAQGGPFRAPGRVRGPWTINGSMDAETFLATFEHIARHATRLGSSGSTLSHAEVSSTKSEL